MTKTTKTIASTLKTSIIAGLTIGSLAFGTAYTANAFTPVSSGLKTIAATTTVESVHFISRRSGKRSDYYGSPKGYKGLFGFRGGFIGQGGVAKNGYNGKSQHFNDGHHSSQHKGHARKKHLSKTHYHSK